MNEDIRTNVEEMLKKQAVDQARSGGMGLAKDCGELRDAKPRLIERLKDRQNSAQRESRRLEQLSELLCLLGKNPEVARILDLLDAVGQ